MLKNIVQPNKPETT